MRGISFSIGLLLVCAAFVSGGADVVVDGGATRVVTAGDHVSSRKYSVGASKGVGQTSTLRVERGARLLGQYATLSLGEAPGATGVVCLVGGEIPALASKANVTNMSHLSVGVSGAGIVTNDHGQIYLRESFRLGLNPGSFGRYVHDGGEIGFCFGGKPFTVGELGRGEFDAVSGVANVQELLVGGTDTVDNVVRIYDGATVVAAGSVRVGGFPNRQNATAPDYSFGRGRIEMAGGTLDLVSTTSDVATPALRLGSYPTSFGELRGRGKVLSSVSAKRACVGFGMGRVVGDGGVLDCSTMTGVTNFFNAADAGWFAENGGAVWLPSSSAVVSANASATLRLGMTPGQAQPDLVNSVRVTITANATAATHAICGGPFAADRTDVQIADLPDARQIVGLWKLADCSTILDWQTHPQAFKSAVVMFRYDAQRLSGADSQLLLLRRENGGWRKLVTLAPNAEQTIVSPTLSCLSGETFNLGVFALLEVRAFRGNVTDPIARSADGWYEIGNLNYLLNPIDGSVERDGQNATKTWYANMAVPDWNRLTLAAPKRVRFIGGVLLCNQMPRDVMVDFASVKSIVSTTNRVFSDGTPLTIPDSAYYRFVPSVLEEDVSTGKLIATLDTREGLNHLQDNLVLDGTMYLNDTTGNLTLDGSLRGHGMIRLFNYFRNLRLTGAVDFDGMLYLGQVQNDAAIAPLAVSDAHIGGVTFAGGTSSYAATQCSWIPPRPNGVLTIDRVLLESVSGWVPSANRRYGAALTTVSNGIIRVGTLSTGGSSETRGLHFLSRACSPENGASVFIDEIPSAARIFFNSNVNVTVGSVKAASVFDCSAIGANANCSSFQVTGPHSSACRLIAQSPSQLPQDIIGYTGRVEIVLSDITLAVSADRVFSLPKGTLLPRKGTLTVRTDQELPPAGRYQVLSWSKGCELEDVTAWPISLEGRLELCTLERTESGLYIVVPDLKNGVVFYVDSETGDDAASGLAPDRAWKSLEKVSTASILPGERVLFRRGGLWRGQLFLKGGREGAPVFYGAYGDGPLPILQFSAAAEAPGSWIKVAAGVWRTVSAYPLATYRDVGNIIFNHGEAYGWKRWSLETLQNERDYWYDRDTGHVYLRSHGDPTSKWASIELALDQDVIHGSSINHVIIDGLAVRYGAAHGIGVANVKGFEIRNCDIYWIGGGVLSTKIADDGTISYTRYGNGIQFWNRVEDALVVSNRLWEIYDAALTDQSEMGIHTNVVWSWNTVWNSEYSYEHFNRNKDDAVIDIVVDHNTFVDSGRPWAHAQRPDRNGAPLMIWYSAGPVNGFTIRNNIFAGTTEQGVRLTSDWHRFVTFSNNLFCTRGVPVVRLVNKWLDFAGFQGLGWDNASIEAEPCFADPANHDYRLRPESPAIGLASDGNPAGACSEIVPNVLYFAPKSTATATNAFGRLVYVAENWTNAVGVTRKPAAGDVLVVDSTISLSANPTSASVPVSGLWYKKAAVMNQGAFHLQAGGLGITNSTTASISWYCGVVLQGEGNAPVYVPTAGTITLQRYFDQTDGGSAVLVKRGGGTLAFQDASRYSPNPRATWKRTRLEAGEFRWSPTGSSGKAYDIQTFPIGHELVFADDGSCEKGAVFSLGTRDCEWRDVALGEAPRMRGKHVISSGTTTNVCIRFTGTPRTNPLCLGAAFTGRAGLWWNPSTAAELRLTNAMSTTTGDIRVSKGTVRLAAAATFKALTSLTVENGAAFAVDAGAGRAFFTERLTLGGGGRLLVGADVTLCCRTAQCDGAVVLPGAYTSVTADWLSGAGRVIVGESPASRTVWDVPEGETCEESMDFAVLGSTCLQKLGTGILRFAGEKSFVNDMAVSNGVLVACGDESLGRSDGTTTFELYSSTRKGVLKVECAPGRNEVSFHRPMTFHYAVDGSHGEFLYLPENATVNFYGLMQTSVAPPHQGPGYPNHWCMSCPKTCVVNWYGGLKASLNHVFPGGTHYIHKALTGGDRFAMSGGAKVWLLSAGNSIGGATGGLNGGSTLFAAAPFALTDIADGRNQTLVFSGAATLDLCGNDQALAVLSSEGTSDGVITSARDAILHIRGNYVLDNSNGGYRTTVTNRVRFTGRAGVSMERNEAKAYPLVLKSVSPTEGELRVVRNALILAKGAAWPNCRRVTIAGGRLTLEQSAAFGPQVTIAFERNSAGFGRLELSSGVTQQVARLLVDGVPRRTGTYGSSSSGATNRDDGLFVGLGLLRVGTPTGATFLVR